MLLPLHPREMQGNHLRLPAAPGLLQLLVSVDPSVIDCLDGSNQMEELVKNRVHLSRTCLERTKRFRGNYLDLTIVIE